MSSCKMCDTSQRGNMIHTNKVTYIIRAIKMSRELFVLLVEEVWMRLKMGEEIFEVSSIFTSTDIEFKEISSTKLERER
jgi:hypothetical protein